MAFTITAELPLGTYRGTGAGGQVDPLPSVSRLYSALLCAAGFGPRAAPVADRLGPCEDDEVALRWLEQNPPDGVDLPAIRVNRGTVTAWRDNGTLDTVKKQTSSKKVAKAPDMSVAVAGAVSWTWSQHPPANVMAALEALCPDVPYLGTTESPVRLGASVGDDPRVSHVLDPDAGFFTGAGHDMELPLPGRLGELVAQHEAALGKVPTLTRDNCTKNEASTASVPTRSHVALARYVARGVAVEDVPWSQVLLMPLTQAVPERDRVRLAVAVHRALIAVIGEGAPPLITGVYPAGARPVNRLAVQIVDATMPIDLPGGAPAAVALLIPGDADPGDLDVLAQAVAALPSVRGPRGVRHHVCGDPVVVSGAQFWNPRPAGESVRVWQTSPPAIPDVRGLQNGPWTFAHSALLSLAFVWKRQLPPVPGRGDDYYRGLVDAVNASGAAVVRAQPLRTSDVRDFVHKVNEHAVVRPYRAQLWLGDLCGARTIQALGQTRHLGGGLLVPHDLALGEVPVEPLADPARTRTTGPSGGRR